MFRARSAVVLGFGDPDTADLHTWHDHQDCFGLEAPEVDDSRRER